MSSIDRVRIIVAGDSGVGKSSLVYLIANNEVLTSAPYTVGCSVEVKLHEYKESTKQEKTFFVELFDIGGSLSHRNTRNVFYQQTNGIILVHDATNRKSHENLKSWLYEIMSKESGKDTVKSSFADQDLDSEQFLGSCQVPVLIVACKVDLVDDKTRKSNRTQQFASEIGAEEIFIDCKDPRTFHAGTTEAVKMSKFFDKVIERKYFSRESSTFMDKRKFVNTIIQSPTIDSSVNRIVSPFTSPGNYSAFQSSLAGSHVMPQQPLSPET